MAAGAFLLTRLSVSSDYVNLVLPATLFFGAGLMTFTRTELDVSSMTDLRIAVYSPVDDDTRGRLPRTRRDQHR